MFVSFASVETNAHNIIEMRIVTLVLIHLIGCTEIFGVYDEEREKQVIREEEKAKAAKERAKTVIDMALDLDNLMKKSLQFYRKSLELMKNKQTNINKKE